MSSLVCCSILFKHLPYLAFHWRSFYLHWCFLKLNYLFMYETCIESQLEMVYGMWTTFHFSYTSSSQQVRLYLELNLITTVIKNHMQIESCYSHLHLAFIYAKQGEYTILFWIVGEQNITVIMMKREMCSKTGTCLKGEKLSKCEMRHSKTPYSLGICIIFTKKHTWS